MRQKGDQERREDGLVPLGADRALSPRHADMARRGLDLARSLDALEATVTRQLRIVRFPEDRSMGRLYLFPEDYMGEARGMVTVPAGKQLELQVSEEACRDLSPLSALKPDDLLGLILKSTPTTDAGLAHLRGLTDLLCLDLENTSVTDVGPNPPHRSDQPAVAKPHRNAGNRRRFNPPHRPDQPGVALPEAHAGYRRRPNPPHRPDQSGDSLPEAHAGYRRRSSPPHRPDQLAVALPHGNAGYRRRPNPPHGPYQSGDSLPGPPGYRRWGGEAAGRASPLHLC